MIVRAASLLFALMLVGCGPQRMADQPKYEYDEAAPGWPEAQAARHWPAGTVPFAEQPSPRPPLTAALLARGRERYRIFCSPCHGLAGDGDGRVVQRGFPSPPSYHSDRLRAASDQHLHDVIEHGYGVMYRYGPRMPPDDRWAIVEYIRALQLSQWAPADRLDARERKALAP